MSDKAPTPEPSAPPLEEAATEVQTIAEPIYVESAYEFETTAEEVTPYAEAPNIMPMSEIITTQGYCRRCSQPWNKHTNQWIFKTDLVKQYLQKKKDFDQIKFKKRDLNQIETKLKLLNAEIKDLNATHNNYYKLIADGKMLEIRNIQVKKTELEKYFSELNTDEIVSKMAEYTEYQTQGSDFLEKNPALIEIITLEQLLNEELYMQYLVKLVADYRYICERLLRADLALKSPLNVLARIINESVLSECKQKYEEKIKIFNYLLCKISNTRRFIKYVLNVNGFVRDYNDAVFFTAGEQLRHHITNPDNHQNQDIQIYYDNVRVGSVIQDAFRTENRTQERVGIFDTIVNFFNPTKPTRRSGTQ
jgi:hypothetical protein